MDENLINSFRSMIEELTGKVDALSSQLKEITDGVAESERNYNKSEFVKRNEETLGKYRDKLKSIEGDDFDFDEVAFSGLGENNEEEYVAALASKIDEQLDRIKKALNVDEVVVESNEEETVIEPKEEEKPEPPKEEITEEEEKPTEEASDDEIAEIDKLVKDAKEKLN